LSIPGIGLIKTFNSHQIDPYPHQSILFVFVETSKGAGDSIGVNLILC